MAVFVLIRLGIVGGFVVECSLATYRLGSLAAMSRVLVVGLPRSGTSWTGRVVGKADGAAFVHEPDGDHVPYAIRAKRGYGRHIDLDADTELPEYERLWAGAFEGGDRFPSLRSRIAERLFETATLAQRSAARRNESIPVRLRAALVLSEPSGAVAGAQHVVVKTVHSALSVEWITRRFNPRVLIVERDPRNVLASWMELGMGGDKRENVQLAHYAMRTWGLAAPAGDAPKIVVRAFVFGVLASALRAAAQRHPDWVVASHEDLCIEPRARFAALLGEFGLTFGEEAERYLETSDRAGEGFRTQRVARDQPEKWRERLSTEDVKMLCGELERFPFPLVRDIR